MLLANGLNPEGMLLEDAADVAAVLVATGRAIAPGRWVDVLKLHNRVARAEALPHNQL